MDDVFINKLYLEYTTGFKNIKMFYANHPEIKFIREADKNSFVIQSDKISERLGSSGINSIKEVQLSVFQKNKIEESMLYLCVGMFVDRNLSYHRFTHHLVVNERGKISIETLILLDERVKFDQKKAIIFEPKTAIEIPALIQTFSQFGKVQHIDTRDNKSFKIFFVEEQAKNSAMMAVEKKAIFL
ncbi:hypothetical protein CDIK_2766 [Cucumispora dikerogammari]|nr:hypothetical protein CDIK_2766 [Cucumispora dikerogammari]